MQVWIFSCYKKRRRRIKRHHRFFGYETFYVSVSNTKVNLIYSWRCTTTTTRRFILASAWAFLSLIFCSVKSALNVCLNSVILKFLQSTRKLSKFSTHRMTMCRFTPPLLSCITWRIGHFLRCVRQAGNWA